MATTARSKKTGTAGSTKAKAAEKTRKAAEKTPRGTGKTQGASEKASRAAGKTQGASEKASKAAGKTRGASEKTSKTAEKSVLRIDEKRYAEAIGQLDALGPVELTRPHRAPRGVTDLGEVAKESHARIVLGWIHRAVLGKALPGGVEAFFAQGWTAQREVEAMVAQGPLAAPATTEAFLERVVEELNVVRAVVRRLTPAGSTARAAVLSSQKLQARAALLPLAEKILAGAKGLQGEFVALDDETLGRAQTAIEAAKEAVEGRSSKRAELDVLRTGRDERAQLALDVLLHTVDNLATAGLTRLRGTLPELRERLIAPIEKSAPSEKSTSGEGGGEEEEEGEGEGGGSEGNGGAGKGAEPVAGKK